MTEPVPSQLPGLWKRAETTSHLMQLSGKQDPWDYWESTSVPQKRSQDDGRHSPISRGTNGPWPAVDISEQLSQTDLLMFKEWFLQGIL